MFKIQNVRLDLAVCGFRILWCTRTFPRVISVPEFVGRLDINHCFSKALPCVDDPVGEEMLALNAVWGSLPKD